MKKIEKGYKYATSGSGPQENKYMDYIADDVNKYLDELSNIEDAISKIRIFSSKKQKTREELREEYNTLVEGKYIQNQSFEDFFVNERNKELEYNSIVIHFQEMLAHYEKIAEETIDFLNSMKMQYQMEQSLLEVGEQDLEIEKLEFAIEKINKNVREIEKDLEEKRKQFKSQSKTQEKNDIEYELDEEATMKNYRNSGYSINSWGWYFNPSRNEYEKSYNPLEDSLFQVFKNKQKDKNKKEKYVTPQIEVEYSDDYTTDYEQRLAKYHEELSKYELDCQELLKIFEEACKKNESKDTIKLLREKMEYYYSTIMEKYNNFINYREKILNEVKEGKLWHPSLTLEQINELKNLNINKPEGESYINYLADHGLTTDYINEPKEPIDFRDLLEDIFENTSEEEKNEKFYDISRILNKVRGDFSPSSHQERIIKLNKIKVLNFNKFKERTIIDIPMRLVRSVIGSSARGLAKLYGKILYSASVDLRKQFDEVQKRVNDLTEEEIDYLAACFRDGNVMSQYKKMLPNSVWNLILQRIFEKNYKEVEKGNFNIQLMHENLLNLYSEMQACIEKLNSGTLSEEEKQDIEKTYMRDNEIVINIIKNMEVVKSKIGMLLNPTGGTKGFEDNWKAATNQITGGKKNSMKDSLDLLNFSGKIAEEIENAINENDGLTAAELYIYREKVRIDKDVQKRTVKNLGGYAQVGSWEWKPFAEAVDYREHHPVQDFLRTTAIVLSIYNVINQLQLRHAVAELQKECENRGNYIAALQKEYNRLANEVQVIKNKYSADPISFEDSYYKLCQQTVGYGSQTVEVIAQKNAGGAAGSSEPILDISNSDYTNIDAIGHGLSSKTNALAAIHNNSNLSPMQKIAEYDKLMQSFSTEMTNVTLNAKQNLMRFISSSSFDHTTLQEVINQAGQVDPKLATDIYREFMEIIKNINNIDLTNKVNAILNNVHTEVDIWPALVTCANIIGVSAIDSYYESQRRNTDINSSSKKKNGLWKLFKDAILDIHDKTDIEQATEDLKEKYRSKQIGLYSESETEYQRELEEWNKKGPLYKLLHRNEKPNSDKIHMENLERRFR